MRRTRRSLGVDVVGRPLTLVVDGWRAIRSGRPALDTRQRRRFTNMLAWARARSPYYAALYRDLGPHVGVDALPVTSKRELMEQFDAWATDREVTRVGVESFIADPARVGDRFLGRYTVATTSGTTGRRGVFVLDDGSFAVAAAMSARMLGAWLSPSDVVRVIAGGGRIAMVNAMGGHFASAIAATRLVRGAPRRIAVFPVDAPLSEIVAGLNRFRPQVLAPYASVGAQLAAERLAGRLTADPTLVVLFAEGLAPSEGERVAAAFRKVRDSYAATECPFLSYRCAEGWLHVNADWVVVEPVDREYRRVPPGMHSHTVLITNLANRVQPILRYDLGDSVVERPSPCPCGSPLPAIRVEGRSADMLTLPGRGGTSVTLPPLLFAALPDQVPGASRMQVVQRAPAVLELRVEPAAAAGAALTALAELLRRHRVGDVRVERSAETPSLTAGGKFRPVVPLT